MTRKDVTYRLTLPSCLSSFSKTLVIGSSISLSLSLSLSLFNLFSPSPHPLPLYLCTPRVEIDKGPVRRDFFCNCFRSTGIGRGKNEDHLEVCPAITLAFTLSPDNGRFHELASRGIKIFQSKESWLGDTMAARVNGISRVSNGGVYTRIGREEARSAMPTHVSCQDVPRQHASSRNLGEAQGAPLHNPDIYRYLLRHLRDEARIKR